MRRRCCWTASMGRRSPVDDRRVAEHAAPATTVAEWRSSHSLSGLTSEVAATRLVAQALATPTVSVTRGGTTQEIAARSPGVRVDLQGRRRGAGYGAAGRANVELGRLAVQGCCHDTRLCPVFAYASRSTPTDPSGSHTSQKARDEPRDPSERRARRFVSSPRSTPPTTHTTGRRPDGDGRGWRR